MLSSHFGRFRPSAALPPSNLSADRVQSMLNKIPIVYADTEYSKYLKSVSFIRIKDKYIVCAKALIFTRSRYPFTGSVFFDLLSEWPDLVTTLQEHLPAFEEYGGQEQQIFDHLIWLFTGKTPTELTAQRIIWTTQLIYVVGKDLGRLVCSVMRSHSGSDMMYRYHGHQNHVLDIGFNDPAELASLFRRMQLDRNAEHCPGLPIRRSADIGLVHHRRTFSSGPQPPALVAHGQKHVSAVNALPSQSTTRYIVPESLVDAISVAVKRHQSIFCFLQRERLFVPHGKSEQQQNLLISALEDAFPLIGNHCIGCGAGRTFYQEHLRFIISINEVGGEDSQCLLLDTAANCYKYCSPEYPNHWIPLLDRSDLIRLAGFVSGH